MSDLIKEAKEKAKNTEIKRGMLFRNIEGTKCVIANVFYEGENEVVTYRYWLKRRKKWKFETDFKVLFLIGFDYGWKWIKK